MDIDLPETEYASVRNDEFTREQHLARIAGELMAAANDLPDSRRKSVASIAAQLSPLPQK